MSYIQSVISENEKTPFTRENQFKRFNYITFMPFQANFSSSKDENTNKINTWFQLVMQYKNFYDATDDNGVVFSKENATFKTLIIKFPNSYLEKFNIPINDLKKFFDNTIINNGIFITLLVSEESLVYDYNNSNKILVKNTTQVTISDNFDLLSFINSFKKDVKKS